MTAAMTEEQIKQMAERFLSWTLPPHFAPDNGISFDAIATAVFEYCVESTALVG